MSKICIAHGGNIGFQGGGTNRVLAFSRVLIDHGHDVKLIVPTPIGEISDAVKDIPLETIPIKPRRVLDQAGRAILVSLKAKNVAKKENSYLQIEHSTLGGIATLMGCKDFILDIHDLEFDGPLYGSVPIGSKFIKFIEIKAIGGARKIIVVSEAMKELLVSRWNVSENKIVIVPNGYNKIINAFSNGQEIEGLLSFIGVITHNIDLKKILLLAESLDERKNICIIGEGPKRQELIKRLRQKNLTNVSVPGFLSDKKAYNIIANSQVCIFPLKDTIHTRVAMHMKTLDYAVFGKAIATDRDGTGMIFEENNAALVSDPANPSEFLDNVHKLLTDKNLRITLGNNAKNLVKDFTWEKQGEKLVKMYEGLL